MPKRTTVYNAEGKPFSQWRATQKFDYLWETIAPPGSEPAYEYRFDPARRWRFDFAWPEFKVAVEIQGFGQGGLRGGHQLQQGVMKDNEKCNRAIELGWFVFRFDTRTLQAKDRAEGVVKQVLDTIIRVHGERSERTHRKPTARRLDRRHPKAGGRRSSR